MATEQHRESVNDVRYVFMFDVRDEASRFIVALDATRELVSAGLVDGQVDVVPRVIYDDPDKPLGAVLEGILMTQWLAMKERLVIERPADE